LTVKSFPRYFPIVFALAGDSTMTRDFAIKVEAGQTETALRQVAYETRPVRGGYSLHTLT
jgi:hypothetical protein